MAQYIRMRVLIENSAYSDYSQPKFLSGSLETATATSVRMEQPVLVPTGGLTRTTSHMVTGGAIFVRNKDTTNYVTLAYTDRGSTARSVKISAGEMALIQDFDPSADYTLTANTTACSCDVADWGLES